MRRSFKGRKRTYTKGRRVTKKRSYKRARVVSRKRSMARINAPRLAMNIIPKTADRLHVTFDYKMVGQLTWANTAEQHIGLLIKPTYLAAWQAAYGPFGGVWPAAGTNVLFPHSVSSTPGYYTAVSRYQRYYVSSVSLTARVTRQDNADEQTIVVGMLPLTAHQGQGLILRNTATAPTSNNSYFLPQSGLASTTVLTGNLSNSQLMMIEQQPYTKIRRMIPVESGRSSAYLHQRYSMKKFSRMGFPYDADSSGILPQAPATEGTPPVDSPYHYFFLQRSAASTPSTESMDIEFDLKVHCTLHGATFIQSAPTIEVDGKEEKKVEPAEEDDDLVDPPEPLSLKGLSLSTPKGTCLNSSHPAAPHERVSTCV